MAGAALRPDIEAARNAMPKALGTKREVEHLAEYLWENERVERMVGGTYVNAQGLVVLTDRRVLFIDHGVMSRRSEDFPIEKISSAQWSAGMVLGTATIFASGNKAEIKNIHKEAGKLLVDAIRSRIGSGQDQAPSASAFAAAPGGQSDVIEQVRKLGELRDAGVLTDEEFASKKADLLSRL